jgi:hypothetical protein
MQRVLVAAFVLVTTPLGAQQLDRINRDRASTMLNDVRHDISLRRQRHRQGDDY